MRDACWECAPTPREEWYEDKPDWCPRCGFFFDMYGMRISEPWGTCDLHSPVIASCPHESFYTDLNWWSDWPDDSGDD